MNRLELVLIEKYKTILGNEGNPDWSFKVYPAMPFIGNNYQKINSKVLLYGSAENLSEYFEKENWINTIGEDGFSRNRYMFDNKADEKDFFPYSNFHMQPIQDGSLLTVAKYIVEKIIPNNKFSNNPYAFLEQIAVGNIAKFSVESASNIDYPTKNKKKLMQSFSYVIEEIQLLKPDIIIIPTTIYYKMKKELNNYFKQIKIKPKIFGIYQVNPQAINITIGKYLKELVLNHNDISLSINIEEWISNIQLRNNKGKYKSVYIDKLMRMYFTWLNEQIKLSK